MTLRPVRPVETSGLDQHSAIVWSSTESDPALIYDLTARRSGFLCVFLEVEAAHAAPKMTVDRGAGFDELTAMVFRPFPFGFYHVSLATLEGAARLRLRPCEGKTTFRFLAFETSRPILVAILHYLFNLRYQKIGLVAQTPKGVAGLWPLLASNAARIRKFFADVSVGSGIRVQQADDDVLARLRLTQTHQAGPRIARMKARLAECEAPLLSFVAPTYETAPDVLRDLVESFVAEDAPYAELILVDDGSKSAATKAALAAAEGQPGLRVLRQARNGGIAVATNAGIAAARGTWVAFIDHDDAFVPGAVATIAEAILDHPDAAFFYTDEIIANAAMRPIGSFLKPTYDSVLLSGMNYINHFSVFRKTKLDALGGLRLDREGSQDYDLLLRYLAGAAPGEIVHVPFLAYTWRRGETSFSARFREESAANARAALRAAYAQAGRRVEVEAAGDPDFHRVRFVTHDRPLVSVVIPNRDSLSLIRRIVEDLCVRTDYPALEIVVPDNGSRDPQVLAFYEAPHDRAFRADVVAEPFNFARMCNRGAALARGEAILFLNNDIEVMAPDWLAEMVECLAYRDTGIVGAKLLYPNGTIQHAGVIVGLGNAAGHWYVECPADQPGPMGRLAVRQTLSAVTGACMLVTRRCFTDVGGFDEEAFAIAYNDIDFCLRARAKGHRTVWTPFATLTHHESLSRGSDETGANAERFRIEMDRLKARHGTEAIVDEAFSPFYDRRYSKPHLVVPDALQAPRRNALA